MFTQIQEKIFYVYGALNLAWIPLVYLFWPEVSFSPPHVLCSPLLTDDLQTAKRSLESIDWLFESKVPFTWKQEARYREAKAEYDRMHDLHSSNEESLMPEEEKV